MLPLGEISILLASYGAELGILSKDFFGIISALVMITSLASFPLIKIHKKIGQDLERFFDFVRRF